MPRGGPGKRRVNRPIRIDGDVAYIKLTKGYEAIIDVVDIPLIDGIPFHVDLHAKMTYAKGRLLNGRQERLHRIIMGYPDSLVDHRDLDGLNCRRYNLRLADHSGNHANRSVQSNSLSGIKGVYFHKQSGLWVVKLKKNGIPIKPKYFKTKEEATAGYAKMAIEIHGEFARSE